MQKMKPAIDQATREADAIKAAYGDPAKAEAMKQQAEAARNAMQQQEPDAEERAKKADELEKELELD